MRIMTYNIKTGRHHPAGLAAVAHLIETYAPDVLGLQELDEQMPRTHHVAQTDWLTRRLRMRGIFAPAMERDGGRYGIALLSRFPIQAHECRLLFRPNYPDADQRPRHDNEQRVALGAMLTPTSLSTASQGRGHSLPLSNAFLDGGRVGDGGRDGGRGGSLKIIVTHLGLTPDQRERQVVELAEFARSWQGDHPTIIMGDFNCDPDAPELAPLRKHFQEACAVCGVQGEARYTFPSGPLGARDADGWRGAIDYVWATHDIHISSAQVIIDESKASDHQPVLVEVKV